LEPTLLIFFCRALTWHASNPKLLVPPNAIERELTLEKARKHHFRIAIVPLLLDESPAADWKDLLESGLAQHGTQSEFGGLCKGGKRGLQGRVQHSRTVAFNLYCSH
jgi:hypothetical protein